jgi:hypothetical protein
MDFTRARHHRDCVGGWANAGATMKLYEYDKWPCGCHLHYYDPKEVDELLTKISMHVKHANAADSPIARKQAVQGLVELLISVGR